MEKDGSFADFDEDTVYRQSLSRAKNESTRNFVVEFGKESAHIAFNLGSADVEDLFKTSRLEERPVRWM